MSFSFYPTNPPCVTQSHLGIGLLATAQVNQRFVVEVRLTQEQFALASKDFVSCLSLSFSYGL